MVDVSRDMLGVARVQGVRRGLQHLGDLTFSPVGARAVRIHFVSSGNRVSHLTVHDGELVVTARRL